MRSRIRLWALIALAVLAAGVAGVAIKLAPGTLGLSTPMGIAELEGAVGSTGIALPRGTILLRARKDQWFNSTVYAKLKVSQSGYDELTDLPALRAAWASSRGRDIVDAHRGPEVRKPRWWRPDTVTRGRVAEHRAGHDRWRVVRLLVDENPDARGRHLVYLYWTCADEWGDTIPLYAVSRPALERYVGFGLPPGTIVVNAVDLHWGGVNIYAKLRLTEQGYRSLLGLPVFAGKFSSDDRNRVTNTLDDNDDDHTGGIHWWRPDAIRHFRAATRRDGDGNRWQLTRILVDDNADVEGMHLAYLYWTCSSAWGAALPEERDLIDTPGD
jgi:hypothetical protein